MVWDSSLDKWALKSCKVNLDLQNLSSVLFLKLLPLKHNSQTEYLWLWLKVKRSGGGEKSLAITVHRKLPLPSSVSTGFVSTWPRCVRPVDTDPFISLTQWLSVSQGLPSYPLAKSILGICQPMMEFTLSRLCSAFMLIGKYLPQHKCPRILQA